MFNFQTVCAQGLFGLLYLFISVERLYRFVSHDDQANFQCDSFEKSVALPNDSENERRLFLVYAIMCYFEFGMNKIRLV